MIGKMLTWLMISMVLAPPAWAGQTPVIVQGTVFPGTPATRNYVTNPTPYATGTRGWTNSGGTFARDVTAANQIDGVASYSYDASATSDYVETAAWTFAPDLKNANCEARIKVKGDASLYTLKAIQGSNTVNSLVLGNTTDFQWYSMPFPCGDLSTSTKFRIEATGNGAAINYGKVYGGEITSLSQVGQAQYLGSVVAPGTASCSWSTNSTSYTNYSATAACPVPTADGSVSAPATKIPGVLIPNYASGDYLIIANASFTRSNVDQYPYFRFSDGTNTTAESATYISGTTYVQGGNLIGRIRNTVPQTNVTIQVQAKVSVGTASAFMDATTYGTSFSVYRFPLSSETAYRPDQTNVWGAKSWSGSATDIKVGASAAATTTRTTLSHANLATYTRYGQAVDDASTNMQITLTLPAGDYTADFNSFMRVFTPISTETDCIWEIYDGTTAVASAYHIATGQSAVNAVDMSSIHGIFKLAAQATKTYSVRAAKQTGSSAANSFCENYTDSTLVMSSLVIKPASMSMPAPLLVNSVTSSYPGLKHVEDAGLVFVSSGSCTVDANASSWIASATASITGNCILTFVAGTFSSPPRCTCTHNSSGAGTGAGSFGGCSHGVMTSSGGTFYARTDSGTLFSASEQFDLICSGPR